MKGACINSFGVDVENSICFLYKGCWFIWRQVLQRSDGRVVAALGWLAGVREKKEKMKMGRKTKEEKKKRKQGGCGGKN